MSANAQTDLCWGGTAILLRRGTVQHSVPFPGLTYLEATAIKVTLTSKQVLILAVYLSPSRPVNGADLTACFGGGLPVLTAGDLNHKHVDCTLRPNTGQGNSYVNMPMKTPV